MALTTNQSIADQVYLAYFSRPTDTGTLQSFGANLVNGSPTLAQMQSLFNTTEGKSIYGSAPTVSAVVAKAFEIVGRSATSSDLQKWSDWVNATNMDIAQIPWEVMKVALATEKDLPQASQVAWARLAVSYQLAEDLSANPTTVINLSSSATTQNDCRAVITGVTSFDTISTAYPASGAGTAANFVTGSSAAAGSTFTLTINSDTINGTTGNDTINASTGLSADGTTAIATTNALDSIDGGAGVDTLVIENTGGKNTLTGTITNVENLTFVGAGNVNNNANISSSKFSGTITFKSTADTAVAVDDLKAQTVALDTVADGTTATLSYDAAQTSATLSNAKAAGDAAFSLSGTKVDTVNITSDKTVTAKKLTVTDTGNTTKTFNVTGSDAAAIEVESTATEAINVSGAGLVTLTTTTTAPTKTLSSVNSAGGVSYATELGTAVAFTGGAGKDSVAFGATTKAQTLGAGDDTATISADLGTGGTIDAGDGTDTLTTTATLAATLDNNTDFNAKVTGFEKLKTTTATNQTLNLTNLDGINYVIETGTGNTFTVQNMVSGGTFEFTDASTATAVEIKDASSGTTDVLNVKLSAAATFAAGTLTVANVETVNINSDDTATSPAKDGSVKHTMTLTADKATSVVISGDAAVSLTLTGSTKITSINASTNEAGIQTNLSVASGITLTGTAKADTITLGNLSVVTGGEGKDVYTLTTPTNGSTYATITDFVATETIALTDKGDNANGAALGTKISLASTAAFADFLAAASAADGSTNGVTKWFVYDNATYVVHDISAETTFQNGADQIVKLTGTLDLSKSTVSDAGLLSFVAA